MTPERIAELRALAEKATPGPWFAYHPYQEDEGTRTLSTRPKDHPDEYDGRILNNGGDGECATIDNNDAAFIAAARTALPEALDAIERVHVLMSDVKASSEIQTDPRIVGLLRVLRTDVLAALEGKSPCDHLRPGDQTPLGGKPHLWWAAGDYVPDTRPDASCDGFGKIG